jgi:hypothetical protein
MKTQKDKMVRHLTPLLSPTNVTVMGDHIFPDRISSIDQHLFRVNMLNNPVSSSDLTTVSDHRSPDGISSIDSILIKDFLRPCTFTSFFQVLDGLFQEGYLYGEVYPGYYLRQIRVSLSQEPSVKSELDHYAYK